MKLDYESLNKRFKKASGIRDSWRSALKECMEYCAPNRETFDLYAEGEDKTTVIYDSTAVEGNVTFANRVQASVMPEWAQWAKLVAGDDVPEEFAEEIDDGLEFIGKRIFAAINHSNFYQELSPALQDLGIGTGCIAVDHGVMGKELSFSCVPLSQLYPEKPLKGVVENVWQPLKMTPHNIKATWPLAELGEKVKKMLDKPDADEVQVIVGQIYDPQKGIYHHVGLSPDDKKVIFKKSYDYKRYIVFRWSVTPTETFGRGVALNVLSDVKTLNKMKEQYLTGSAFSINPMYTAVTDGIFNPYTFVPTPNGVVPVGSNMSNNPTLQPLQTGNNINHGSMVIAELQQTIKEAFFASPLGEVGDPVKSATEQMLRMQEMLRRSGASFGRLNSELIVPLLNAVVSIMTQNGTIEPVQIDGKLVKIQYQSPLAKAEQMEAFQNTQVWLQTNYSIDPQAAQINIKTEEIASVTGEQLGVTRELVRTEEERAAVQEAMQQQMQQVEQ